MNRALQTVAVGLISLASLRYLIFESFFDLRKSSTGGARWSSEANLEVVESSSLMQRLESIAPNSDDVFRELNARVSSGELSSEELAKLQSLCRVFLLSADRLAASVPRIGAGPLGLSVIGEFSPSSACLTFVGRESGSLNVGPEDLRRLLKVPNVRFLRQLLRQLVQIEHSPPLCSEVRELVAGPLAASARAYLFERCGEKLAAVDVLSALGSQDVSPGLLSGELNWSRLDGPELIDTSSVQRLSTACRHGADCESLLDRISSDKAENVRDGLACRLYHRVGRERAAQVDRQIEDWRLHRSARALPSECVVHLSRFVADDVFDVLSRLASENQNFVGHISPLLEQLRGEERILELDASQVLALIKQTPVEDHGVTFVVLSEYLTPAVMKEAYERGTKEGSDGFVPGLGEDLSWRWNPGQGKASWGVADIERALARGRADIAAHFMLSEGFVRGMQTNASRLRQVLDLVGKSANLVAVFSDLDVPVPSPLAAPILFGELPLRIRVAFAGKLQYPVDLEMAIRLRTEWLHAALPKQRVVALDSLRCLSWSELLPIVIAALQDDSMQVRAHALLVLLETAPSRPEVLSVLAKTPNEPSLLLRALRKRIHIEEAPLESLRELLEQRVKNVVTLPMFRNARGRWSGCQ